MKKQFSIFFMLFSLAGCITVSTNSPAPATKFSADRATGISIGGEEPVVLAQNSTSTNEPHFTKVVLLPGRGMNTFQITAFIPEGSGGSAGWTVDVLNAPPLPEAAQIFSQADPYGNLSFKYGGALLAPFANRIRGHLNPADNTLATTIAGKKIHLPANWKGTKAGAEPHAMHGLILGSKVNVTDLSHDDQSARVDADLEAGDFNGHWPSKTQLSFRTTLQNNLIIVQVTAKNVGLEKLPIGLGWHPYFNFPSGDRKQVRVTIPATDRALVNNYDDVFPTGKVEKVKGTPYDFTRGQMLGEKFLDDCFMHVERKADEPLTAEIVDKKANYGLRIRAISPQFKAYQVYAPVDHSFVALEPQFNIGDPYGKEWGAHVDNGMVLLAPGESVTYLVELALFTPH